MADKYVRPSELSVAVLEQLHLYSARVEDELNKGARKIARETNDIITQHSNFNILSGKYLKSFAIKQNERGYWVWYVKPPNYRLTHLLENGHDIVNGNGNVIGRARAFPHITYGNEYACKRYQELLERTLKG